MRALTLLWLLLCCWSAQAQAVRMGVLMHVMAAGADDAALREALAEAHSFDPAFIVVNGLKAGPEPCRDQLFRRRKAILEAAELPVFLSMAGSDWLGCRDRRGRPAHMVWLNSLREQLFGSTSWNGSKQIALKRQSAIPAFRSYAENTRWTWNNILFATLHQPAENNHFVAAAGSNSEFEDRLTANRYWLSRLLAEAKSSRARAVIIITDGEVLPVSAREGRERDGFLEMRRALRSFADKLRVPVLVLQGAKLPVGREVRSSGRLFHASLPAGVNLVDIDLDAELPFVVTAAPRPAPGNL